ncbi:hypothetical protein DL765_004019 [Monosporascus sp. GIB2]|nr:hypothetical protein DL765_004019 [Monosporascus sp. GIB2]
MKFTTLTALLTMAVAAAAAPTEVEARTGGSCNNDQKSVCCDGILNCVVQVIAPTCSGTAYCCETDAPEGALVNVELLNCVQAG